MFFNFFGFFFLPLNKKLRKEKLCEIQNSKRTIIVYEAPHKLITTLKDLEVLLENRQVVLARELTKIHEEFIRGNIKEIIENAQNVKGEIVLIIEGNSIVNLENEFENMSLEEHYKLYKQQGMEKKEIIKRIAKDRQVPKNEVYKRFL